MKANDRAPGKPEKRNRRNASSIPTVSNHNVLTRPLVGESEAKPHHTEVLIITAVSGFNSGRAIDYGC